MKHGSEEHYFEQLAALQLLEKNEEIRVFEQMMRTTSVQQRVLMGICWHPLKIVETGFGFGDYPFVIVERTRLQGSPHQFGSGKTVGVFSTDTEAVDGFKGVIQFVNGDQLKIIFFADELPEVLDFGKLGVNLFFDENAFKVTEDGLREVAGARNCRLADVRDALIGRKPPEMDPDCEIPEISAALNNSQQEAVKLIIQSRDFCIVHGPPGTGKTTTIIEAARLLCTAGNQVMMAAPSNAAADWLTHKAVKAGLKVVRIGNPARIDEELERNTVEGHLQNHRDYSVIKELRKRGAELRRMAGKYKRQFGHAEREQRKLILNEAKGMAAEARKMESYIIESTLDQADVVACTLIGSNHALLSKRFFSTVFIDEAAQAPEPACWIPILKAERVVLAGDPFQLPPTIKSEEAARKGLAVTLIEKLIAGNNVALLNRQYRMNEQIMAFSNAWFYGGKLVADTQVSDWEIDQEQVVEFIDTAGLGWSEINNPETKSLSNPEEANLLWDRVESLGLSVSATHSITVGIISPYREQVTLLEQLFRERAQTIPAHLHIQVQTIDSFQGQERDAIYVSLVRSNDKHEIGFLKDYRRMNVAMTRARKKLVLIGDSATLANDAFYRKFIEHAEQHESYRSAWEYV
jgi:ATP-dependent RNA/DNA helicase IGHMBP2